MNRVISVDPGATTVNIGPGKLGTTVGSFATLTNKISLTGTLGKPDFDRTTGTRNSPTSLWCVDANGPPPPGNPWQYEMDAALYDTTQPNDFKDRFRPFPCIGSQFF
jgi:hypothetical protein